LQSTIAYIIFTAFLVGIMVSVSLVGTQQFMAQSQVSTGVELRNVVLLVEKEMLDVHNAVLDTHQSITVRVSVNKYVQGRGYELTLKDGTLKGSSGAVTFEATLPNLLHVEWDDGIFKSGANYVTISGMYDDGLIVVTLN